MPGSSTRGAWAFEAEDSNFEKESMISCVRVQRSQRVGAGVEGFTLAPEWQGWNSWRWGKERHTGYREEREKKAQDSRETAQGQSYP